MSEDDDSGRTFGGGRPNESAPSWNRPSSSGPRMGRIGQWGSSSEYTIFKQVSYVSLTLFDTEDPLAEGGLPLLEILAEEEEAGSVEADPDKAKEATTRTMKTKMQGEMKEKAGSLEENGGW